MPGTSRQKKVLDPLELRLQKVVRLHVSAVSRHSSFQWRENFLPRRFDSSQLWFVVRMISAWRLDIGCVEMGKKKQKQNRRKPDIYIPVLSMAPHAGILHYTYTLL